MVSLREARDEGGLGAYESSWGDTELNGIQSYFKVSKPREGFDEASVIKLAL